MSPNNEARFLEQKWEGISCQNNKAHFFFLCRGMYLTTQKGARGPGSLCKGTDQVKAQEKVRFQKFKQKCEGVEKKSGRENNWLSERKWQVQRRVIKIISVNATP